MKPGTTASMPARAIAMTAQAAARLVDSCQRERASRGYMLPVRAEERLNIIKPAAKKTNRDARGSPGRCHKRAAR
jgi:hypothetical protein